jgi:hypothetical protein
MSRSKILSRSKPIVQKISEKIEKFFVVLKSSKYTFSSVNVLLTQKHIKQVMSFPLETNPKICVFEFKSHYLVGKSILPYLLMFTQAHEP